MMTNDTLTFRDEGITGTTNLADFAQRVQITGARG